MDIFERVTQALCREFGEDNVGRIEGYPESLGVSALDGEWRRIDVAHVEYVPTSTQGN